MSKIGFKRKIEVEVETPKNISEPVISFLKVFESNPRRFKVFMQPTTAGEAHYCFQAYKLSDKVTGENWRFLVRPAFYGYNGRYEELPAYLTEDEKALIIDKIISYFNVRKEKLEKLNKVREQRKLNKERDRLKTIYCKEEV